MELSNGIVEPFSVKLKVALYSTKFEIYVTLDQLLFFIKNFCSPENIRHEINDTGKVFQTENTTNGNTYKYDFNNSLNPSICGCY